MVSMVRSAMSLPNRRAMPSYLSMAAARERALTHFDGYVVSHSRQH